MLFKYNHFIKESKSRKEIEDICHKYFIYGYTINEDGSIDVEGNVELASKRLEKIPLNFRHVSGSFYCESNRELSSLEGCPETVGGNFHCFYTNIKTLEGGPKTVGDYYGASNNKLISLEGGPNEVGGAFLCYKNELVSLVGGPKKVGGSYRCTDNKLTSLVGAPDYVGGTFRCDSNKLNNLEGSPKTINGLFFNASGNNLTSLEGFTETFRKGMKLMLVDNPITDLYLFLNSDRTDQDVMPAPLLNEWEAIDPDTMEVSYSRLVEIFNEMGSTIPKMEDISIEHYKLVD
jgi:hypothetical protein